MFEEIRTLFAIDKNDGFTEKEISLACEAYGGLPEVLRQYYLHLGKINALNQQQNRLLAPDKLIDAGEYVIFYLENQAVAQWAVKKSDLQQEDPPVYCSADMKHFQLECDCLSDFLCAMANFQAASWGLSFCSEEIFYLEPEQLQQIESHYRKKPYELCQWIPITFYGNHDDEVICVLGGEQMQYASSDQVHYEELEQFMMGLDLEVL